MGDRLVMRHQRADMEAPIVSQDDLVQSGQAGEIDERLGCSGSMFEFDEDICPTGNETSGTMGDLFSQGRKGVCEGRRDEIVRTEHG